ncbi:hypothetical protein JCM8547_004168 [Rhodosporidiobolus lusitaniae]
MPNSNKHPTTGKVRTSSTKGKHIVQVNPLPKGYSCSTCRQRKVRCSGERPACRACLRTARFEGRDLTQVVCHYDASKAKGGGGGKKKAAAQKNDVQVEQSWAGGSGQDLSTLAEVAGQSYIPVHSPSTGYYTSHYDQSADAPAYYYGAPPGPSLDYHPTPPLSYTSSASPDDSTLAYSPDLAVNAPSAVFDPSTGTTTTWTGPLPPMSRAASSPQLPIPPGPVPRNGTYSSSPRFYQGGRDESYFEAMRGGPAPPSFPGGVPYSSSHGEPMGGGGPSSFPTYPSYLPPKRSPLTGYDLPAPVPSSSSRGGYYTHHAAPHPAFHSPGLPPPHSTHSPDLRVPQTAPAIVYGNSPSSSVAGGSTSEVTLSLPLDERNGPSLQTQVKVEEEQVFPSGREVWKGGGSGGGNEGAMMHGHRPSWIPLPSPGMATSGGYPTPSMQTPGKTVTPGYENVDSWLKGLAHP